MRPSKKSFQQCDDSILHFDCSHFYIFKVCLVFDSEMYRNQMESFGEEEDIILLLQGTFEEC